MVPLCSSADAHVPMQSGTGPDAQQHAQRTLHAPLQPPGPGTLEAAAGAGPVKTEQPAAADVSDKQATAVSEPVSDRPQLNGGAQVWMRALWSDCAPCQLVLSLRRRVSWCRRLPW
jgi:hypothetical protein